MRLLLQFYRPIESKEKPFVRAVLKQGGSNSARISVREVENEEGIGCSRRIRGGADGFGWLGLRRR